MSFNAPFFLLLGLLAAPIILLYMLRLRRQEMLVSSSMLWQKLLRDREANSPWQKLRRNLLLILQLLILAALVFALARPFFPVDSVIKGSVVILLDGSASMAATDVEPTRFASAQSQVKELIGTLSGTDQMSVILVGDKPQILLAASNDKNALTNAVDAAQVENGEADWEAAVALAAGAAQGFSDARIVIVSDGGLSGNLPAMSAQTVYLPIGVSGENLGISALATRDGEEAVELFASITNYGANSQEALLTLHLNDLLFDSRRITVDAGNIVNLTWEIPEDANAIQAALTEISQDHLAADNVAYAIHEGGIVNQALIVTPGNIFLEQIFSVLPGIEAFKADAIAALPPEEKEQFDLYVFDSTPLPSPPPDGDLLLINPPQGFAALFEVTGAFSNTATIRVADDPVLQFVDWSAIHVRQAQSISAPWMQTMVEGEGGGLIMIGEQGGDRMGIIAFDLHDSDLPLQVSFPILMSNLINWLTPGKLFESANGLQPGDPVRMLPAASVTHAIITSPTGEESRLEVTEQELIFAQTSQPGIYRAQVEDAAGIRPAGAFAVNLFSSAESRLQPAENIQLAAPTTEAAEAEGDVGQLEFWGWLAGIAILILIVEWWVFHRGTKLPELRLR